jgi:capsular polysaccharide biosynthesis protein
MTRLPEPLRPYWPLLKRATVFAARTISPVAVALSRLRPGRALPARSTSVCELAADDSSVTISTARPPVTVRRRVPRGLPAQHFAFEPYAECTIPEVVVADFAPGHVVRDFGAVLSAAGDLVFDLSPYFGARQARQHPLYLSAGLPRAEQFDEPVAVLATRGTGNYGHFLFDVMPRLDLLREADLIDAGTRYFVPAGTAWQREILAAWGVPPDRVLDPVEHPHVVGRLLVTSLPDDQLRMPQWVADAARLRLLPGDAVKPHRKLYVGRHGGRHSRLLLNETQLLELLAEHGFEDVRPELHGVAEQARMFAEAEIVVGVHGAALSNLVFCSPGARVLELLPADFVDPAIWAITAELCDVEYRYLIGEGRAPGPGERMWGVTSDFAINLDDARLLLAELGVGS